MEAILTLHCLHDYIEKTLEQSTAIVGPANLKSHTESFKLITLES